MTIAQSLLPEFDREMTSTRAVLERVPAQHAAWKPHPKSFALGDLAIEQEAEPFGVIEGFDLGIVLELLEGLGHAGEAELVELGQGRVGEHGGLPQWK